MNFQKTILIVIICLFFSLPSFASMSPAVFKEKSAKVIQKLEQQYRNKDNPYINEDNITHIKKSTQKVLKYTHTASQMGIIAQEFSKIVNQNLPLTEQNRLCNIILSIMKAKQNKQPHVTMLKITKNLITKNL